MPQWARRRGYATTECGFRQEWGISFRLGIAGCRRRSPNVVGSLGALVVLKGIRSLRPVRGLTTIIILALLLSAPGCTVRKQPAKGSNGGGTVVTKQPSIPVLKSHDWGQTSVDTSGPFPIAVLPKNVQVKVEVSGALAVQCRFYTLVGDDHDPYLVKDMVPSATTPGLWTLTISSLPPPPQLTHLDFWAEVMPGAIIPNGQVSEVKNGRLWLFLIGANVRN